MDEIKDQSSSKLKTPEDLTNRTSSNFYSSDVTTRFKKLGLNEIPRGKEDAAVHLDNVLKEWKEDAGWEALQGARVLDIASGTAKKDDSGYLYYPYFAEIAAENGAHVTVADKRGQTDSHRSLFTCIEMDILEEVVNGELASHPTLAGKKFDIIASRNFVGGNPEPEVSRIIKEELGVSMNNFEDSLIEQLKPLVAEGGIIDLDGKTFLRKVDGEFREEPAIGKRN